MAKTRILLKKQRYKYRIRRRPSFYRPRKSIESEIIKELPSACLTTSSGHRSSFNPTSSDDFFSSSAIPGTSSSGVYSSSTTDYPTTATTNTFTSETSPNSLSPLAIVMPDLSGSAAGADFITGTFNPAKRLSIAQFLTFQQQKQSDMCEQYVLNSANETVTEVTQSTLQRLERRASHHPDASIIVTMPQSNIVVYVDDFASYSTGKELTEDEEDELEEEELDAVISLDDPTAFNLVVDGIPEEEEEPTSTNLVDIDNPEAATTEQPHNHGAGNGITAINGHSNGNNHQVTVTLSPSTPGEHRRVASTRKSPSPSRSSRKEPSEGKKKRKTKKLQFRNKITKYDNNIESKQESKAAKTLTIITGEIYWILGDSRGFSEFLN